MGLQISNIVECANALLPYFTRDRADEILDDLEIEPEDEEDEYAVKTLREVVFVLRRYYGIFLGTTIPRTDFNRFEKITKLAERLESELAALSPVSLAHLEDAIKIEAHPHTEPFGVCGPEDSDVEINPLLFILRDAAGEVASWREDGEKIPRALGDEDEESAGWSGPRTGRLPKIQKYRVGAAQALALAFDDYNPEGAQGEKYAFISKLLKWIVDPLDSSVGVSVKTIEADLHEHGEIPAVDRDRARREREKYSEKMFWDWALDQ